MQIKTTIECHLTPVRIVSIKKFTNNKCWRGMEKSVPSYSVGGNINWCSNYENIMEVPYKTENRGRSQDGGGIGRGDHFLFYKFIERTTER